MVSQSLVCFRLAKLLMSEAWSGAMTHTPCPFLSKWCPRRAWMVGTWPLSTSYPKPCLGANDHCHMLQATSGPAIYSICTLSTERYSTPQTDTPHHRQILHTTDNSHPKHPILQTDSISKAFTLCHSQMPHATDNPYHRQIHYTLDQSCSSDTPYHR